jgi:AcrR family transcriptional regulator
METKTRDKIRYSSFKLFLENGYEATNIRDICKDVGIKASTLYFYYKSKEDLFFYIYDEILLDYIKYIQQIEEIKKHISVEKKLFILLKEKIDYFASDISKRKFILRYHLFPPQELASAIRQKYKFYKCEENKVIFDIIGNCRGKEFFRNQNINDYLIEYKRLENYLIYEMAVSGIKINDKVFKNLWNIFWNDIIE